MTPTKHPLCNDILRALIGDENCDDLHIMREDGAVWSFWKPCPEELAALIRGGPVALQVKGSTHPPLCVHVMTTDDGSYADATPEQEQVIDTAISERYAALISLSKRIVSKWHSQTEDNRDRRKLTDEFLDLMTMNRGKAEIVRAVPADEPQVPTDTKDDVARYRADAEGWKAEAERWRKVAENAAMMTDGQRTFDVGGWMNECLCAEARADRLQAAVDSVIDQLNRVSVETPNPDQP